MSTISHSTTARAAERGPNPAFLSAAIAALFPPGAVAAELRAAGDPALLMDAEAACLGRAVPKRIQEFAAGRLCARRALAELGVADFPLLVAPSRQPVWPDDIVGSITHTAGLCAAVVAERRRLLAVGLDCEIVGHVAPEIWSIICAPVETEWLASVPAPQRAAAVTLLFAAKEAFYKCQFALTGEWLYFQDVIVRPQEEFWRDAPRGVSSPREPQAPAASPIAAAIQAPGTRAAFTVTPTRTIELARHAAMPALGHYRFDDTFVTAGIGLRAGGPSDQ